MFYKYITKFCKPIRLACNQKSSIHFHSNRFCQSCWRAMGILLPGPIFGRALEIIGYYKYIHLVCFKRDIVSEQVFTCQGEQELHFHPISCRHRSMLRYPHCWQRPTPTCTPLRFYQHGKLTSPSGCTWCCTWCHSWSYRGYNDLLSIKPIPHAKAPSGGSKWASHHGEFFSKVCPTIFIQSLKAHP